MRDRGWADLRLSQNLEDLVRVLDNRLALPEEVAGADEAVRQYYKCSKLSEVKFRYLLRLFALDLAASDAARLMGLSVRAVNDVYLLWRRRLDGKAAISPAP